jgi:hypothetical protein
VVTNYAPTIANVMTVAEETAAFAEAQRVFANKYAPNSTEYAIFRDTFVSGDVNHSIYLQRLNAD